MDATPIDPLDCPLAWWELHRRLPVGATTVIRVAIEHPDATPVPHRPDEPDRSTGADPPPPRWDRHLLDHALAGAGFSVERVEPPSWGDSTEVTVRRERTLADTVAAGMRLLIVGLNPSLFAADAGVGFARPGNRAWPALLASGLARIDRDPLDMLRHGGVGMSDLVKRATTRADELRSDELVAGLGRLDALCRWMGPGVVCVLGITGWRTATGERRATIGPQDRGIGGRPVYVAPNPSGLNAHTSVDDLVGHLRAAVAMGDP